VGSGCGSKSTAGPDADAGPTTLGPDGGLGDAAAHADAGSLATQDGGDAGPVTVTTGGHPSPMPGDVRLTLLNAKKLDLLFDIDNSASMGDKQAYLAEAVPDLVRRLVTPNCIDAAGNVTGISDAQGNCGKGNVEFPPVRDMHIGVVTSALGPRLGDQCDPNATQPTPQGTISRHNDDQAHLINRGSDPANLTNYTEAPLADLGTANFLNWSPHAAAVDGGAADAGVSADAGDASAGDAGASEAGAMALQAPPIGDPARLEADFKSLIVGAHSFGCGIESQLESWYRFLIQPDPYASLGLTKQGPAQVAQWVGTDTTILAQRAAFLRPDSLVVVIVLSDENDSEVDVRSFGGTAWNFMSSLFHPPRGTAICQTSPGDPSCTSCAFGTAANDPQCQTNGGTYSDSYDWGYDLNLRHVHEPQKYGVSVQFPVQRYVVGLTSPTVPDRNGEYPAGASTYQGLTPANQNCTNPLFAAQLPAPPVGVDPSQWQPTADEVCRLPLGTRAPGSVLYMHIGGVAHQLLQLDPADPNSELKNILGPSDWPLILGNDTLGYDYSGIDPHMVESYQPRTGVTVPPAGFGVSPPTAAEGTDPISGREWTTNSKSPAHQGLLVDREYACTFKLQTPRQCDNAATSRDATLVDSCDCQPPSGATPFTPDEVPAVCNGTVPTQQDYAKAYPTIRELLLAKLLGDVPGANQGVISSICPIHTVEAMPGDPVFGYRPAMTVLLDRLKSP
jgi:hypothetical protein